MEKALARLNTFRKVELGTGSYVDLLTDFSAMEDVFMVAQEAIVEYPDALGEFFGTSLERDGFISFLGSEKKGKTWLMLDLAWRAMEQRRRVAFFEIGDLSQRQILNRFYVRAARHPMKAGDYLWPTKITRFEEGLPEVEWKKLSFESGIDMQIAKAACKETLKSKIRSKKSNLRISTHPNSSISVSGIRNVIDGWEREDGWVPDVIVVDYADILAPEAGYTESRDQINASWKAMRRMSQELHCLVVTATQANAQSYKVNTIDRSNFSEDKRKFAHVTGMIGINQDETEKENNIIRLNWVVLRESGFSTKKCVFAAQCLALASPLVRSTF